MNNSYYLKSDIENNPEILVKERGTWSMSDTYIVDTGYLSYSSRINLNFHIPTYNSPSDIFWGRVLVILEPSIIWEYSFNIFKPALLSYSDF